jgi:hypothetical protein
MMLTWLFFMVQPISEQMSVAFMIIQRNYAFDAPDEPFILFQDTLIEQDRLMVENRKPVRSRATQKRDTIFAVDTPLMAVNMPKMKSYAASIAARPAIAGRP